MLLGCAAAIHVGGPVACYSEFRVSHCNADTTYSFVEDKTIDFIYTNPSAASCIESEFDAAQIVTLRNLRQGNPLNAFGGIAFARSDRCAGTTFIPPDWHLALNTLKCVRARGHLRSQGRY